MVLFFGFGVLGKPTGFSDFLRPLKNGDRWRLFFGTLPIHLGLAKKPHIFLSNTRFWLFLGFFTPWTLHLVLLQKVPSCQGNFCAVLAVMWAANAFFSDFFGTFLTCCKTDYFCTVKSLQTLQMVACSRKTDSVCFSAVQLQCILVNGVCLWDALDQNTAYLFTFLRGQK